MTVGDPESKAEGREQSCVKFYGTVYRQQSEIDPQPVSYTHLTLPTNREV